MIIYGAGGHAKVIISCLHAKNQLIHAIFDDDPAKKKILGIDIRGRYDVQPFPEEKLIMAIGNNAMRQALCQTIFHRFGTIYHPSALIERHVAVGAGTVILHGAIVQSGCILGEHVIVNTAARIDHDCLIESFAHIAPGAILCGNVQVGEGSLIGAGSIVVPNIRIGKNCVIAAGSVVTTDIPDGQVVRGNPARIIKARL